MVAGLKLKVPPPRIRAGALIREKQSHSVQRNWISAPISGGTAGMLDIRLMSSKVRLFVVL